MTGAPSQPVIAFWSESTLIARSLNRVLTILNVSSQSFEHHGALIDVANRNAFAAVLYIGGTSDIIREDTAQIQRPCQVLWCPVDTKPSLSRETVWAPNTQLFRLVVAILRLCGCAPQLEFKAMSERMSHESVERDVEGILGTQPARSKKDVFSDLIHHLQNAVRDGKKRNDKGRVLDIIRVAINYATVKQIGDLSKLQQLAGHVNAGAWDLAMELAELVYSGRRSRCTPVSSKKVSEGDRRAGRPLPEVVVLFVDDRKRELEWFEQEITAFSRNDLPFRMSVQNCEFKSIDDVDAFLRDEPACQAVVVDWDLSDSMKGDQCIRRLRAKYPNLLYCVLTAKDPLQLLRQVQLPDGVRAFQKRDPTAIASLYQHVVESINKRAATPFFSALKEYSQRPVSVFHAQITSGGKSLRKSSWLSDFYEFYGQDVFNGETTTTLAPLDSLLEPKGSIMVAQELAAKAFGAERTYFVTNGTSTAVKILYQALLKPGDSVLVDRCCHKSHHYGLVLAGANPAYLASAPLNLKNDDGMEFGTGIWKGVSTGTILEALDANPEAKMLSLTNCTFDGYIHPTKSIVEHVIDKLVQLERDGKRKANPDDFVFLFDEAWFGYATFLPATRELTAMAVAAAVPRARVYAVQSTHKTLTAFRQGSMIHARDPHLLDTTKLVLHELRESLFTHTTTSPSYNMLASLDAGRMQADLEGRVLWSEAWNLASDLRMALREDSELCQYFHVLDAADMDGVPAGGELSEHEWYLDDSKVTLLLKPESGMTGEQMRKALLDQHDVHFNKSTSNTCLFMVNGGSTASSVSHLIQALRELASTKRTPAAVVKPIAASLLDVKFPATSNSRAGLREYFFGQFPDEIGCTSVETVDIAAPATRDLVENGKLLSRVFVIPYPPGFPVLVPGQVVTLDILDYLRELDVSEVHGLSSGLLVNRIQ